MRESAGRRRPSSVYYFTSPVLALLADSLRLLTALLYGEPRASSVAVKINLTEQV